MKTEKGAKSGFSSRLGFVLAAAGSAVGLGNLWRFPYLAAQYGGGMFLLVYIILAVTFGFALMITEVAIGRKTRKSCIMAYTELSKKFSFLGYFAALVPIIIFPYYCVIGGWVVKFLGVYITGQGAAATVDKYFETFTAQIGEPIVCLAIFLFLTALVVLLGVQKGIEKISKILMPLLILMSLGMAIYSLTIPGAMDGFLYYIKPEIENFSLKTVVAAMGQLFYSMSLAMGIMVTYGSYMKKEDNLEKSVRNIELFDTGIAFLSGMMIVPAVFAFTDGDPEKMKGATLMFVTMPKVFNLMPAGNIIGFIFFLLVFFAALTSAISLMETIVSIISDKFGWNRKIICVGVMIASFALAIPSTLGNGIWSGFKILGMDILSFFDFISNNIMMPIVALLTAILIGFIVKPKYVSDEVESSGKFKSKKMYNIVIKFVVPICMAVILVSSIVGFV